MNRKFKNIIVTIFVLQIFLGSEVYAGNKFLDALKACFSCFACFGATVVPEVQVERPIINVQPLAVALTLGQIYEAYHSNEHD